MSIDSVELPKGRPALMGIVNVTPDSFSDGGLHFSPHAAVEAGLRMLDEGADILDVGGESTRPRAEPVELDEELRRVIPVVERLSNHGAVVSIDTMKSAVAREALDAGARIVNDVSGLRDDAMVQLVAERCPTVCIMHMQGTPATMQIDPVYGDVVEEVAEFLFRQAEMMEALGLAKSRIWIDPGIGFGKTLDHNLKLIRGLPKLVGSGYATLLGVSRKSFIGRIPGSTGETLPVEARLPGSIALQVGAQLAGVRVIRTHDVLPSRRAIDATACTYGTKEIPVALTF